MAQPGAAGARCDGPGPGRPAAPVARPRHGHGPATCLDEGLAAFASASPAVIDLELGATAAAGVVAPRWAPRLAERDPGGRTVVAGALADYYRRAIDPFWPRVSALLERERARAARLLGEQGLDHLLASLHPTIGWDPPVLTIDDGDPVLGHDCYLDGRGVVFVPSLFCRYGYPMSTDAGDPDAVPVIHYPVEPGLDRLDRLWAAGDDAGGRRALASLLGATRAVVLDAIAAGPCTTSELARRSATSLPTASQHASVLREAGLISTRRVGRAVLHSLTSVGAGLLTDCG